MLKIKIRDVSWAETIKILALIIISVCAILVTKDVKQIAYIFTDAELEFINENDYEN